MKAEPADLNVKALTALIADRLSQAASLAKEAQSCANVGNRDGAVQIAIEIDQPHYDALNLITVTSLLNRFARDA